MSFSQTQNQETVTWLMIHNFKAAIYYDGIGKRLQEVFCQVHRHVTSNVKSTLHHTCTTYGNVLHTTMWTVLSEADMIPSNEILRPTYVFHVTYA